MGYPAGRQDCAAVCRLTHQGGEPGRVSRLLLVALFLEVGFVLVVVPWSSFWDRNYFAESLPLVDAIISNNYIRGAVSGLGVINIAAGIVELFSILVSRHVERSLPLFDLPVARGRRTDVGPVICMVTDRLRLDGDREQALVERVGAAARAGVHLIQVRERDLAARPLTRLVERCVEAVRGTRARVLVNDRVDVALAAGAHGVHLRGDSMPAARARMVAPPAFLIGRSVHSPDEALRAQAAEGLDYLVFGTVFATASKPGAVVSGLDALARVAAATRLPVIAIGGMNASDDHGRRGHRRRRVRSDRPLRRPAT